MSKEVKTNAMRILDKAKISYETYFYEVDEHIDGISVANKIGESLEKVYKTLLTKGKNSHYVFVIPVDKELDLKKAAKSVGEKSIEMLHVNDLLSVTGYIRGGCSPIGMKKLFPTVFNESAKGLDFIIVSGGKRGCQIKLLPSELLKIIRGTYSNIIFEEV